MKEKVLRVYKTPNQVIWDFNEEAKDRPLGAKPDQKRARIILWNWRKS